MPSSLTFHRAIKILIWLIGLCTLTALTLRDFLPILEEYRHNNVGLEVDIRADDGFKAPRLVVCIPFYRKKQEDLRIIAEYLVNGTGHCQICEQLEHAGWDVWNKTNLTRYTEYGTEALYHALTLQYIDELFKSFENGQKDVLSPQFSSWNHPILTAAMNFFVWREISDYTFGHYDFGGHFVEEFLHKLHSYTNKTTLDLLYSGVLNGFCDSISFTEYILNIDHEPVAISNTTCRDLLDGPDILSTFDLRDGLWFGLPAQTSAKVQLKWYQFYLLENRFFTWKMKDATKKKAVLFYPDLSAVYVSQVDPTYMSYIDKVMALKDSVDVSIRYGVNMRAKDKRSGKSTCQNDTSDTCFSKCTKLWIADKCGCIPFTFKKGIPYNTHLPYCTFEMYSVCRITEIPESIKDKCLGDCKNVCEHVAYNWAVSHKGLEKSDTVNRSEFNLYMLPMVTTFADFSWVHKVTPEQFMSQMGGIVNFYVGFSGLSIFATLLIIVEFLERWSMKRRKPVNEEQVAWNCMQSAKQAAMEMFQDAESVTTDEKGINYKVEHLESEVTSLKNMIVELNKRLDKNFFR